jgi:hypothetical protein
MVKIKDRFLLGAVAGLGGNLVKTAIVKLAKRFNWSEFNGSEKAAGMLLPAHKITQPSGRLVGYIADNVIAITLGTAAVYMLSLAGRDKAALKGALSGQVMWSIFYGVLSTMGATQVHPPAPKTVLTEFVAHTAYGAATAALATKLGDPDLFNGSVPLIASPVGKNHVEQHPGSVKPENPPAND